MSATADKCDALAGEVKALNAKYAKDKDYVHFAQKEVEKGNEALKESQNNEATLNNNNNMLKGLLNDAKTENDKLIVIISKNSDEINDLKFKNGDADNKINELKSINKEYNEKIVVLNNLIEEEKNKMYEKSLISQKDLMSLREEFAEKLEAEARAHRAMTSNLHKSELEAKALETKLQTATDKVQTCKSEISMLKSEIASKKDTNIELEITIKNLRSELGDSINSYKDRMSKLGNKCSKYITNAMKKIQSLKMEITYLKKDCNFDKMKIDSHTMIKNITNRI